MLFGQKCETHLLYYEDEVDFYSYFSGGKYFIQFEDGVRYHATTARIKEGSTLQVGAEITCRFRDGRFYKAHILQTPGE